MEKIHFKVNKKRMFRLFIMASILLIVSLILVFTPGTFTSSFIQNTLFIRLFGIFGAFFFGLAALYTGRKYLDTTLGLTLTEEGLLENTTVFRFGMVEWKDIKGFEIKKLGTTSAILIKVKTPEKYIERIDSPVFKNAAQKNLENYGSPLFINSSILVDGQEKILNILNQELNKR